MASHHWLALQLTHTAPEDLQLKCFLGGWKGKRGNYYLWLSSKLIFTILDLVGKKVKFFVFHLALPILTSWAHLFPVSMFFGEPQWCGKKMRYKLHWIFHISYTLMWNRYCLWGRSVFLCWLLYTLLVPRRKIPLLAHVASEVAVQVSHVTSSFLCFSAHVGLMLRGMENDLVSYEWLLRWIHLCDAC